MWIIEPSSISNYINFFCNNRGFAKRDLRTILISLIRLNVIISTGNDANEFYKTRIGKIYNTKSGKKLRFTFQFWKRIPSISHCSTTFSTTFGMIFLICRFYHSWYCIFELSFCLIRQILLCKKSNNTKNKSCSVSLVKIIFNTL